MREKRFEYAKENHKVFIDFIQDNEKYELLDTDEVVNLLNGLNDENNQLKSLLKDAEEEIEALKESNKGFLESLVEHEAED